MTFEYVLLRDENDREEDIERLRAIATRVPCKINVIPLNPFPGVEHGRPDTRWVETFLERLMRPSLSIGDATHDARARHRRGLRAARRLGVNRS